MRRRAPLVLVVLTLLGVYPAGLAATVPEGPRLATVELRYAEWPPRLDGDESMSVFLRTVGPDGQEAEAVLGGRFAPATKRVYPLTFHGPSWSADGSQIAFAGGAGKRERIYLVDADGTGLRPVPGTDGGRGPVFSPDGRTIAFFRSRIRLPKLSLPPGIQRRSAERRSGYYSSTTTWTVSLDGGRPRQLTPWRNGLEYEPTSFSPTGEHLLLVRDRHRDPAIVRSTRDGGELALLVHEAEDGAYSPDGRSIAFVSYRDLDLVKRVEDGVLAGEIYSARANGTGLRRLTRTRGIDETAPSWAPSGNRIAYLGHRIEKGGMGGLDLLFPVGNALFQANADGSCPRRVYEANGAAFYGAQWQPGLGRDVGSLVC